MKKLTNSLASLFTNFYFRFLVTISCVTFSCNESANAQINYTCSLNTLQSIQNGSASVTSSTLDIGTVASIFDGNDATLARSANINPLVITLSFNNTVNLTSIRVIQSYGEGWFTLEAADVLSDLNNQVGSYQKLLNQIATVNGVPIGGTIIAPVTASKKIFRLTVKKTVGDNFVHLNEWGLVGTIAYTAESLSFSPASITMYPTWKTYLTKAGWYQVPQLFSVTAGINTAINKSCISWSVSNTAIAEVIDGVLVAKTAGTTFLTGTTGNGSVQIPLTVKAPVLQPEKETNIDNFLKTPASCYSTMIPVVAIIYLPTLDGVNIDVAEMGGVPTPNQTLVEIKKHILNIFKHTKFSLEEGSKYRGYSNPHAEPFLGYKVIDYIFVYEPVPRGYPENNQGTLFTSDYNQIVERHRGKYYIDTIGVKEIWVMGYHFGQIVPAESNMSSPTTGNISNSLRREDDMPKYSKTYVLYNYSMSRSGNEAVHNHGHQIEAMCDYVAFKQDAGNTQLFNRDFRGYTIVGQGPLNRAGDTHHPPNSRSDYDYENSTLVSSDILDWKPAGGTQSMVNYLTWANIPYAWPSGLSHTAESNWYIMWMQSLPGKGNKIPYGTKWMTNWWRFMSDWDSTTVKIGLYQNNMETNPAPLTPTITAGGTTTFCSGGSVILTSNAASGNQWYKDGVAISGSTNPTLNANASGSYTVKVTIGCESSISDALVISVNPAPPTPIITSGTTTFCTGGSVTLTSNAASGNQWYKDGIAISGSTNPTLNANAGGSYTVKVTVGGCASNVSNALVVSVNPAPPTPIITAGGTTTFCTGGSITLTSNAANGNQWYKDGIAISGSTATTLNVTSSGSYTAKVTMNGCESAVSNAISVLVNSTPNTPSIIQNGIILSSSAASGNQWYYNNALIPGAINQNHTPANSGDYKVQVTINSCSSSFSNTINFIVTNVQDLSSFNNLIKIFPNPFHDKLIIRRTVNKISTITICLYDITGREMKRITSNSLTAEIDMSRLTTGNYILWIEDKVNKITGRKMITKQ